MSNTKTITALNAKYLLVIPSVFPAAMELEGFAADAAYSTDDAQTVEAVQGVDGKVSFGLLPFMTVQTITLQPNSKSILLFNTWALAQQMLGDVITANGVIVMKSIKEKYVLSNGALTGFKPIPDVKKVIGPLTFKITWETVLQVEA